ncbi:cathelicidin-B1-like [Nyctibius grandis]|uniref:cathelicidin-B1-like n=1 Tax=Nyctibius grandis TaxID=48427 RepID=UPI0035BC8C8F
MPPPLLLVLVLGLAGATTPVPELAGATTPVLDGSTLALPGSVPPSPPGPGLVSYEDAIAAAVELLNARAVGPYVLRLRDAQPRPGWPGDLQQRQELSFTVEETSCRAPGTATTACKSRWLGAVSWCRGFAFLEQQQPTVELSCETLPAGLGRPRPSRLPVWLAKVKERLRGFFRCGRVWIRDRINLRPPQP